MMPRVTVNNQTVVVLSPEEVEHCLRCWLSQKLAPCEAPKEKDFSKVRVDFNLAAPDSDYAGLESVTLTYEPAPQTALETTKDRDTPDAGSL